MYPTSSEGLNRETDEAVYFFTVPFEPLNNFSAHRIKIWGEAFPTAEHAFQWKKFSLVRPDVAERILDAGSPNAAKEIAMQYKADTPSAWHAEKLAAMEEILRAKLAHHEDVRDALARTAKRAIVENSPVDSFWGSGPNGSGENALGKLWVKIRDTQLP